MALLSYSHRLINEFKPQADLEADSTWWGSDRTTRQNISLKPRHEQQHTSKQIIRHDIGKQSFDHHCPYARAKLIRQDRV